MRKCKTPYCRRNCRKGGKDCNTCHSTKVRAANPLRAGYRGLKSNAKRRGIIFELTFEQYQKLVKSSNYLEQCGKTKGALQIDRIWNDLGYVEGNLRVVTQEQNRAAYVKYLQDRKAEEGDIVTGNPNDVPF